MEKGSASLCARYDAGSVSARNIRGIESDHISQASLIVHDRRPRILLGAVERDRGPTVVEPTEAPALISLRVVNKHPKALGDAGRNLAIDVGIRSFTQDEPVIAVLVQKHYSFGRCVLALAFLNPRKWRTQYDASVSVAVLNHQSTRPKDLSRVLCANLRRGK